MFTKERLVIYSLNTLMLMYAFVSNLLDENLIWALVTGISYTVSIFLTGFVFLEYMKTQKKD